MVRDAVVPCRPAPGHQLADPVGIGQGSLFGIGTAVAALAAVLVMVTGSRLAYAAAFLVAAGAAVGPCSASEPHEPSRLVRTLIEVLVSSVTGQRTPARPPFQSRGPGTAQTSVDSSVSP